MYIMYKIDNIPCTHLEQVTQNINARTPNGCEECLKIGSQWVHSGYAQAVVT